MGAAADVAQVLSAGAATTAAIFAAVSAATSRAAVERANLAFVWPKFWAYHPDEWDQGGHGVGSVVLNSDGAGVALDVRWSLLFEPAPGRSAWRQAEAETASTASPVVRALRPGERAPSKGPGFEREVDPKRLEGRWWVVVRWSDSAGRRWEFKEGDGEQALAGRPKRVRRPCW